MKSNIKETAQAFINKLKSITFPQSVTCDFCGNDIFKNQKPAICEKCLLNLPFITNACKKCGKELVGSKCEDCSFYRTYFDQASAVFNFDEQIQHAVHRFKYGGEFHLKRTFSYFLFHKFATLNWNVDCVIAVPMNKDKEILRIKNQALELANEFCTLTKLENASESVIKLKTQSQTKLTRKERFKNAQNSLKVVNSKLFKRKNVLIIDDIFTTGATTNALANLLKTYGANKVYILTIATVPST